MKRSSDELLPVLIIPGFMSSGLEIRSESSEWNGKRVWLNLTSLGFHKLGRKGPSYQENEEKRLHSLGAQGKNTKKTEISQACEQPQTLEYSETMHDDYEQQIANKSFWLRNMALSDDMCNENPGYTVRPIQGLAGVDYLTDGRVTKLASYVFGPLINALKKIGYVEEVNLDAAPYDWRLPPSIVEERDNYLTETMDKIQRMVLRNNGLPVVLLCHSMGCKMGHYLLNFIKDHPKGGEEWIERYIHTFVVVGAPHLGVSKTIRASITGDKMTLDAFLSDEDGLILGRSLGSVPWMMPSALPQNNVAALPTVIRRREGAIEVRLETSIDIYDMLKRRKGGPPEVLRLCVAYGDETACTQFKTLEERKIRFDETFIFAAPASLDGHFEKIQFFLQEPGTHAVREKDSLLYKTFCCPFKWCLCCPCTLVYKLLLIPVRSTLILSDKVLAALGSATTTASSHSMKLEMRSYTSSKGEMCFPVRFNFEQDKPSLFLKRYTVANARVRFIGADHVSRKVTKSEVATLPPLKDASNGIKHLPSLPFEFLQGSQDIFEPLSGSELLLAEGLENMLDLLEERYDRDPLGPRTRSASSAPPVKRVHAIYGINVPTEVSAVYRRRSGMVSEAGRIASKYILDTNARIDRGWRSTFKSESEQYELKQGIIFETPSTPQSYLAYDNVGQITRKSRNCCGDGTVPYWNLQHCQTWKNIVELSVDEIEGAEHREILADPRFHAILQKLLVKAIPEST